MAMLKQAVPSNACVVRLLRRMLFPPAFGRALSSAPLTPQLASRAETLLASFEHLQSLPRGWRFLDGLRQIRVIADAAVAARETFGLDAHFFHAAYDRDHGGVGPALDGAVRSQMRHQGEVCVGDTGEGVNQGACGHQRR